MSRQIETELRRTPNLRESYHMLQPSPRITTNDAVQAQLRALDKEHRETLTALNQAEASVAHARKLNELNYHRRRKPILNNGHDDNAE